MRRIYEPENNFLSINFLLFIQNKDIWADTCEKGQVGISEKCRIRSALPNPHKLTETSNNLQRQACTITHGEAHLP